MKSNANDQKIYERMKEGSITASGFLGDDARSLPDIVADDEAAFARLGLDFEATAARLEALRDSGNRGLGEAVSLPGGIEVKTGDARGLLPCPWYDGAHHKNSVEAVIQAQTGSVKLVWSDLSIHLMRKHHFLQGRGSPYRLEPESLAILMRAGA